MPPAHPLLPFFVALGALFGGLAGAGAYVISYAELRRRRLRPDQNPRRMALQTAIVTFAVFFVAALALSVVLPSILGRAGR